MQSIIYTIMPNGKIQIDVQGTKGDSCRALTKELEEKLGVAENVEFKAEYYEQSGEHNTHQINTGGSGDIYKSRW